jgi:predicted hydrocarbon binding protein/predicted amino acid-binding ACT domain protein
MERHAASSEDPRTESKLVHSENGLTPAEDNSKASEGNFAVRPLHLPVFEQARDKTLAHFVITMRNQVGVLEELSQVLTRSKVNILSGIHEAPVGSDGKWSFFVDATNATSSPDELSKEFSRSPNVLDVKFRVSRIGFISDLFHFPPRSVGPILVMSVASLREIFRHLREILGTGPVGDVLIHQLGIGNGKGIGQTIQSLFGKRPNREELEEYLHLIRTAGWGVETLKELDYENSAARIQLAQSTECGFYDNSSKPQSQFVRGTYEATFSALFEKPVNAEEVRCISKGDGVCEFVIKPR